MVISLVPCKNNLQNWLSTDMNSFDNSTTTNLLLEIFSPTFTSIFLFVSLPHPSTHLQRRDGRENEQRNIVHVIAGQIE